MTKWLLRHPRFHVHFTPTSASWLNLVERWFAELTNRKLRRSAHRSVTELKADVQAWINAWNADPKPFVWTKTADEILETLAAYCQRINDSRHEDVIIESVPGFGVVQHSVAECIDERVAMGKFCESRSACLFYYDLPSGRGRLMYRRFDGNLGLIIPI
ncbi:hypothetical protein NSERKGN1266_22010 [Nocardia seriolae]|nr:hypothetical protein NSERKGN1266_22010 [Nocardia seriolae]